MTPIAPDRPEFPDIKPFSSWKEGKPPRGYFRGALGTEGKDFYETNGYFVLDRVLPEREVEAINAEAARICRNSEGKIEGAEPAPADMPDAEALRRILCVHLPHKISPFMHNMLSQPAIVQALTTVIGPDVKCMQSMLFIKASGKPGQAWHQDEDYIPTRDRSLIGAWIALDDATLENGCLWIIPGSHKPGILWDQKWHEDRRFDCTTESHGFPYTEKDEVPVEVKKGSVVFFHGYTLHRSLPNYAKTGFRRALVNHYMSATSFLPWMWEENVGLAKQDYRDIVIVAGKDPYAYKGYKDLAKPHVRASGEGGCMDWKTKKPHTYKN